MKILILLTLISLTAGCPLNKGEERLNQGDCYCENTNTEFGNYEQSIKFKNTKLAFFGDSGVNSNSNKVLQMLKNENVDSIIHLGDLDYEYNPKLMEQSINKVFSESFPYIYVIGNHDTEVWDQYQINNINRLKKSLNLYCSGNIGVQSYCIINGIQIVLSGIDVLCDNHNEYLKNSLNNSKTQWKICGWHKVHSAFQLSNKSNEVSYSTYQTCIDYGALIMTAHSHTYARTYPITNAENKIVNQNYKIYNKQSMIFNVGTGGYSLSSEKNNNLSKYWWDSAYTRDHFLKHGSIICNFNVNSVNCYYKTIENKILDSVQLLKNECQSDCPECTKPWEPPINDGCGNNCPTNTCKKNERCSATAGYTCVLDPRCQNFCPNGCINQNQVQPANWCGGSCELPYC